MKIWILRKRLDKHNDKPVDCTEAFETKEDALEALNHLNEVMRNALHHKIEVEKVGDDYFIFETSRLACNSWVEEIELK